MASYYRAYRGSHFAAFEDRKISAAALRQGVNVQPVSINYYRDPPDQGLLLGYAALDAKETLRAIYALQRAFREIAEEVPDRLNSAFGSVEILRSGPVANAIK